MRLSHALRTGVRINLVLTAALCLCAQGQAPPAKDAKDVGPEKAQGLPPRVAPTDYQAHAKAGALTIAAEFQGHAVPTAQGTMLTTEDYVAVEVGFFGPPDAHVQIAVEDFSLRINGRKVPLPGLPYGVILSNLKDPEWEPPEAPKSSKTSIGTGGGADNSQPPVVHIPIEVQRAMAQKTQKASLPLGDRVLPQAGLIFFRYGGKPKSIKSVELIYSGAAGKAALTLHP